MTDHDHKKLSHPEALMKSFLIGLVIYLLGVGTGIVMVRTFPGAFARETFEQRIRREVEEQYNPLRVR